MFWSTHHCPKGAVGGNNHKNKEDRKVPNLKENHLIVVFLFKMGTRIETVVTGVKIIQASKLFLN